MKQMIPFALLIILVFSSCSSIRVSTDYDVKTDFDSYKTFAFYKKGIDKASISDLDKRRILRAVEAELLARGMKKSTNPDVLVNIFTKSRKRVDVTTDRGIRSPYWYPSYYSRRSELRVSQYTEGTLFIDLIDAKEKQLVWQGIGTGALRARSAEKKEEKIQLFVKEIMTSYPPVRK